MTTLNGDVLTSLREGRGTVVRQIKKLNAALESFDNLIELFAEDSQVDLSQITDSSQNLEVTQGPTEFVRSLFRADPTKRWRPPQLVAALGASSVEMSRRNIEAVVASILRRLKDRDIEQGGKKRKHWYKWKDEQESLY